MRCPRPLRERFGFTGIEYNEDNSHRKVESSGTPQSRCRQLARIHTDDSGIVGNFVREDDLIAAPVRMEAGYALVPDKPGLGVELDEEAVCRYAVAEG